MSGKSASKPEDMMEKNVNVDVSGSAMQVTLILPDDTMSPSPALILCHHREGVDEFTVNAGQRLAAGGFVVAIPNMYHRRPAGEAWEISRKTLSDINVVADLHATAGFLAQQSSARPGAIGIIGHCMGGRSAFLGAAVMPQVKAAVVLYGGGIFKTEGEGMPAPIALIKDIRASILGLYGDHDHIVSLDEINRLVAAMKENNIRNEFHIYKNAGHAFQDYSRPELYFKTESEDAWVRCFNFLNETLRNCA
jgi:carboxymethylenebutenolidase